MLLPLYKKLHAAITYQMACATHYRAITVASGPSKFYKLVKALLSSCYAQNKALGTYIYRLDANKLLSSTSCSHPVISSITPQQSFNIYLIKALSYAMKNIALRCVLRQKSTWLRLIL